MQRKYDLITLKGLAARGFHGVYEQEREEGQLFVADLVLEVDVRAASRSDDLADTVNYAAISEAVVAILAGEPVNLIETLASRVAAVALHDERVAAVEVTIHKPEAPLAVPFDDVAVTIYRRNLSAPPMDDVAAQADAIAPAAPGPAPAPEGGFPAIVAEPAPAEAPVEAAVAAPLSAALAHEEEQIRPVALTNVPVQPVPVVIALGANLGDAPQTLAAAVERLGQVAELEIDQVSPLVVTAPVLAAGQESQPNYYNAVVTARTSLSPLGLLWALQGIEDEFGRERGERWGARTLDLDVVDYEGVVSSYPELTLPHPRVAERAFVLYPLALLEPGRYLTGNPVSVADLSEMAPDRAGVLEVFEHWGAGQALAAADAVPAAAPDALGQDGGVDTGIAAPVPEAEQPELSAAAQDAEAHAAAPEQFEAAQFEAAPAEAESIAAQSPEQGVSGAGAGEEAGGFGFELPVEAALAAEAAWDAVEAADQAEQVAVEEASWAQGAGPEAGVSALSVAVEPAAAAPAPQEHAVPSWEQPAAEPFAPPAEAGLTPQFEEALSGTGQSAQADPLAWVNPPAGEDFRPNFAPVGDVASAAFVEAETENAAPQWEVPAPDPSDVLVFEAPLPPVPAPPFGGDAGDVAGQWEVEPLPVERVEPILTEVPVEAPAPGEVAAPIEAAPQGEPAGEVSFFDPDMEYAEAPATMPPSFAPQARVEQAPLPDVQELAPEAGSADVVSPFAPVEAPAPAPAPPAEGEEWGQMPAWGPVAPEPQQ
ncbi:MAG: 2-amino-4-hydroxy-6-hydroxymethyldihydropteridine diphosphokinase [Buchananella hordeovulneris]|nr:2-amino-4-hydroxy-6-hydroxymethyldihydropteridine diphosphokinase [Buchananella hordeovulneris]